MFGRMRGPGVGRSVLIFWALMSTVPLHAQGVVRVRSVPELRQALAGVRPGTRILIAPGEYSGGLYFANLHGAPGRPIVLAAEDRANPPRFVGGNNVFQFSDVSYFELQDLVLSGARFNGLNIDDGGTYDTPSHHVVLRNLRVSEVGPEGNRDGIKLSGLDDFRIENCRVERWGSGGAGIDMVGCHRGIILGCVFRQGGATAIQSKGGSAQITIRGCRFEDYGLRGVNIGGITGLEFFRPPVDQMPANGRYEAKEIRVEGCTFVRGGAPVAFVGVDGAVVRFNTLYHPGRWALRILQENTEPGFVPSRNGVFEDNLIVFRSDQWASGGVNIGADTAPDTFRFARNFWYCSDRPEQSRPNLPTPEQDPIVGKDPLLRDPERGDFGVRPGSPAASRGAHAFRAPRR
ncbi:MAG: right-handed parallel beta-helix repeat-containing protein [Chloroherpetonaceae bacterium]|nr:right-handed parallel beta-helix repeat-containing protein [Chloroherpetonaceae bacterium]